MQYGSEVQAPVWVRVLVVGAAKVRMRDWGTNMRPVAGAAMERGSGAGTTRRCSTGARSEVRGARCKVQQREQVQDGPSREYEAGHWCSNEERRWSGYQSQVQYRSKGAGTGAGAGAKRRCSTGAEVRRCGCERKGQAKGAVRA